MHGYHEGKMIDMRLHKSLTRKKRKKGSKGWRKHQRELAWRTRKALEKKHVM